MNSSQSITADKKQKECGKISAAVPHWIVSVADPFILPYFLITSWFLQPHVTNVLQFNEMPGRVPALGAMSPTNAQT